MASSNHGSCDRRWVTGELEWWEHVSLGIGVDLDEVVDDSLRERSGDPFGALAGRSHGTAISTLLGWPSTRVTCPTC